MVIEEGVLNLTEAISILPPNIIERIEGLTVILKAVGVAVIAYLVYVLIMAFVNFRNARRMGYIEKKVNSIDKKLDILIKKKKK